MAGSFISCWLQAGRRRGTCVLRHSLRRDEGLAQRATAKQRFIRCTGRGGCAPHYRAEGYNCMLCPGDERSHKQSQSDSGARASALLLALMLLIGTVVLLSFGVRTRRHGSQLRYVGDRVWTPVLGGEQYYISAPDRTWSYERLGSPGHDVRLWALVLGGRCEVLVIW